MTHNLKVSMSNYSKSHLVRNNKDDLLESDIDLSEIRKLSNCERNILSTGWHSSDTACRHTDLTRQQKDQYAAILTPVYDLIINMFLVNMVTIFRKVFVKTFKVHIKI